MYYPLKLRPIYKDYIWGGRNLEKYKKHLPEGIIAESWELSCLNDNLSVIINGKDEGKTLQELIFSDKSGFLGENYNGLGEIFPLLFKIIDAQDDLSIQVHPNDYYANKFEKGQFGKTEIWYVIDAKKDASIIFGFKDGLKEEYIKKSIRENKQNELYNEVKVQKGDIIYIPSGTVHAIKSGLIIAEIQQSSNLTYRIYDYDRKRDGQRRELHIDKALDVIDINLKGYIHNGLKIKNGNINTRILSLSKYFNIKEFMVKDDCIEFSTEDCFNVIMMIEGNAYIECDKNKIEISAIETFFIPAKIDKYRIIGSFKIIHISIPKSDKYILDVMKNIGFNI
ncbi:MAG: type I phosphomannose isomerase catalytic subunit [Clostridiales bacterium]